MGLNRISQIVLFPRSYDDRSDYQIVISDDKQSATVVLQKPDKFRLAHVAVAVDD